MVKSSFNENDVSVLSACDGEKNHLVHHFNPLPAGAAYIRVFILY